MGFRTFLLVRSMYDKQQHVILFVLIYVVFLNGLQIYTYARSFIMFGKGKAINVGGLGSFIDFKTILLIRALYSKQKHVIIFVVLYAVFLKGLQLYTYALYCFGKWITTKDGILCSYIDFKTILLIRVMYGKQQHAVLFVVIDAFWFKFLHIYAYSRSFMMSW